MATSTQITIKRLRELEAQGLDDLTIEIVARIERVLGTGGDPRPYTYDLACEHGETAVADATDKAARVAGKARAA